MGGFLDYDWRGGGRRHLSCGEMGEPEEEKGEEFQDATEGSKGRHDAEGQQREGGRMQARREKRNSRIGGGTELLYLAFHRS